MPTVIDQKAGSVDFSDKLEKKNGAWFRHRTFKICYYVLGDGTYQSEEEIVQAVGIPPLFFSLNGAYCQQVSAKETNTVIHPMTGALTGLWEVECSFDSKVDEDQQNNEDPTSLEPTVTWSTETEEEYIPEDVNGNPIQTTADEPLFVDAPRPRPILNITRFEYYPFDPNVILNYATKLNQNEFYGAPRGCAYMVGIEAGEKETEKNFVYCAVTYKIKFKMKKVGGNFVEDQWFLKLPNVGHKMRTLPGADPIVAKDTNGTPITVALDAAGVPLPVGVAPILLDFQVDDYADFNNLSLGP